METNAIKAAIDESQAAIMNEVKDFAAETRERLNALETDPRRLPRMAQAGSGPFRSFGEQLQAVMLASSPSAGHDVLERLAKVRASAGLEEAVPSDGGFLVQQDFSNQLLNRTIAEATLASRCNKINISSGANSVKLPAVDETSRANGSRWGGIRSYWEGEGNELTTSKPKFRSMTLELNKLTGLCYCTNELAQDAAALETVIGQGFQDEFTFRLDDAIFRGSGAGQPLGIFNSPALVTVSKETGQAADTVIYENIRKMWTRMPARNRRRAIWVCNQECEEQLYGMVQVVGTGGAPVFLPGGGASEAPYATLYGRPLIPIEQASALGDLGDIALLDMSQYLLAEKGGMRADVSMHVAFVTDELAFRFVLRVDGQPAWNAPLTPYKGANDLSPFVTLAERA